MNINELEDLLNGQQQKENDTELMLKDLGEHLAGHFHRTQLMFSEDSYNKQIKKILNDYFINKKNIHSFYFGKNPNMIGYKLTVHIDHKCFDFHISRNNYGNIIVSWREMG